MIDNPTINDLENALAQCYSDTDLMGFLRWILESGGISPKDKVVRLSIKSGGTTVVTDSEIPASTPQAPQKPDYDRSKSFKDKMMDFLHDSENKHKLLHALPKYNSEPWTADDGTEGTKTSMEFTFTSSSNTLSFQSNKCCPRCRCCG